MQVRSIGNVSFKSNMLTPEVLEARASALESNEYDFGVKPEVAADVLEGKLKETKMGRKLVNMLVSGASFAAAALSFKKVAPKLRHGIATATGRVANKFGNFARRTNNKNISQIAGEMSTEAVKVAAKGDGSVIKSFLVRVFGEKNALKVLGGLKQVGIETGGDVADTAIAIGAATLAGREAGDIADGAQKERTLKDALGDITKVMSALPGADIISEM